MGLLSLGTPLPWSEAKEYADHVRKHGIEQFLNIYHSQKNKQKQSLLWGDEIEYLVVKFDDKEKTTKLSLRAFDILKNLEQPEHDFIEGKTKKAPDALWRPEYGRYMIEGTPGQPYGSTFRDLITVEKNMKLRRQLAIEAMHPDESAITLVNYPRLGCPHETVPDYEPNGTACQSLFVPDEIINPHARFPTLTANIRRRRGSKVKINMPIFHDKNTLKPFIDPTIPWDRQLFDHDKEAKEGAALADHIYMDAMAFGMGCCCLQITFQACNIDEARRLYDQLAPVAPLMMALSANSPIYRGYLANVDARWNVISSSVDDRTPEERGEKPLQHDRFIINKSRYDSIDSYLSNDSNYKAKYDDINLIYDQDIYNTLRENDVDEKLAKHISHLFIRDPLVIFKELLNVDDKLSSDHFENLQSTNWQTMRFKPPPPNSSIGWRVEFRSMEVQLSDFENAAYSVFIVLLTRVILSFGLNFYIPISKIDANMQTAHKRNAVLNDRFYFRKNVFSTQGNHSSLTNEDEDAYELMTMDEIINGKVSFVPLIHSYLNSTNIDIETRCKLSSYLSLISKRASGELMTGATYLRQFVQQHPDYKQDSIVTSKITYDLVKRADQIAKGEYHPIELLGSFSA
ncbi:glutamate-cysteine ligase-domain-containing protein [Cokeromyces recurvatus]|uniref:glutamate-cysteine ligase-domain-containing protein n=1 Tax=Cokeromyces recurvatus TaxID=90255 RepID=UPI00222108C5|nr:glutamate-cysteine ligase-domain-containing protein [Cokeromyces recurvatus]KAI7899812.1 glutamate-cysteine ligase-domain-containing protein [Cokeromyces recurvatus]